jgi:oligoendopeptidase F
MTREERYGVWHELEQVYLPWRDYDGDPFLEKGGFWMQKQHIFLYPFYYIDYALAQMGAFDFFLRMREDRERAWNDYLNLCKAGGTVGYFDLLKIGNLRNPFAENTVKDIAEAIEKLL